jgi:hypothetical protein
LFFFIILLFKFWIAQGELAHRLIKTLYQSTNKQDVSKQIAKQERRRTRIRRQQQSATPPDNTCSSDLPLIAHHCLTSHPTNAINLAIYLREHEGDPAIKVTLVDDVTPHFVDSAFNRTSFQN